MQYDAEHREGGIHFRWLASIQGRSDGTIVWYAAGEAVTTFLKNRIGWCVLHPIDGCAGQACTVVHTNGAVERGQFPVVICPHQPFRDIRTIRHEVRPGLTAEVSFGGDVFEMEDQRNWTDSSYKTYSTPLDLPFPVVIETGTRVEQSVRLTFSGTLPRASAEKRITIQFGDDARPLPEIGFGYSGHLTREQASLLRAVHPAHLRIDLNLEDQVGAICLRRLPG